MAPNILSIPPGRPFLKTLAAGILSGQIVETFRFDGDPLALAGVTIYVPSRRAARSLGAAFTEVLGERFGVRSAILPTIRPIGEGDEAAIFATKESSAGTMLPAMPELERRLALARLAREWRRFAERAAGAALRGEEAEAMPERQASAAEALALAGDLGALLDELETEGTSFEKLAGLAPDALAAWWQTTLSFLEIVTEHWPQHLKERGVTSEAAAKNVWLRSEAARLLAGEAKGPVILAGSTATAPATP